MAQPQPQIPDSEAPTTAAAAPPAVILAGGLPGTEHDPAGHDIIPDLFLAGGLFVPIESDLAAPYTPPATRIARLREILALLDSHSTAVRSNLLKLFVRDSARIAQNGRRQEALPPAGTIQDPPPGLERKDLDEMINNMTAPHNPAQDYNITLIPEPDFVTGIIARSPREWAANELFRAAQAGADKLESYDKFIEESREFYQQALKKELEREAE
ncbi:hypothetical protein BGZ61DRAFT_450246 [Ilyonectria robusta]|uniref:uncharacterized protein n=1 Tax=Ilyonectria robusta TaxID=1079257 RepID=UPI001E8D1D42|nr:uncharacterized protein BGZ61DRAFT_450246 [Ilyonectria robusta]KAH8706639.1 hypothetical protein BGZ61DRAFT_450246 [Ilyonectria robusta]